MKHLAGKTFWGKAAGVIGVAAAASGGVVAAVAKGVHEATRNEERGFKGGFSAKIAQIDLAAAAKDAAEFGDARIAPAADKARPVVKKAAVAVAMTALSVVTQGIIGGGGPSGA